jgi:hypothetical protein
MGLLMVFSKPTRFPLQFHCVSKHFRVFFQLQTNVALTERDSCHSLLISYFLAVEVRLPSSHLAYLAHCRRSRGLEISIHLNRRLVIPKEMLLGNKVSSFIVQKH